MTEENFRFFEACIMALGLIVAAAGVYIAYDALREYKKDNELSVFNMLNEKESKLFDWLKANDTLRSYWAYFESDPPESLMSINDRVSRQIQMLFVDTGDMTSDNSGHQSHNDTRPKASEGVVLRETFSCVDQLDKIIWSHKKFDDTRYGALRGAYDFAAYMLFVAENAHKAYKLGAIRSEDWVPYETYITEVGAHPLYLSVVYWEYEIGGYSHEFAVLLQEHYRKDDTLREAACAIYPDIIEADDWPRKVGQRQWKPCKKDKDMKNRTCAIQGQK